MKNYCEDRINYRIKDSFIFSTRRKLLALLLVFLLIAATSKSYAAGATTYTWTGNTSAEWNLAGNWTAGGPPASGDNASIPASPSGGRFPTISAASGTVNCRDLTIASGATVTQTGGTLNFFHDWKNSGSFNASGGTVVIGGSAGAAANFSLSANNNFYNLTINSGFDPGFDNSAGSSLNVAGSWTDNNTGVLSIANAYSVTFNGSGAQTITSSRGTNNSFVNLVINNTGGTVSLGSSINMVAGTAGGGGDLTVKAGSTLDILTFNIGANTAPASLILETGTASAAINGSAGTITLGGNVTVNTTSGNNGPVIGSKISLGATRTFTVADEGTSATDLTISGVISGAFGITKSGAGKMVLSGTNTFTGATLVTVGTLNLQNNQGAGTTAGGVTVSSGAMLELQNNITVGAEALSLNGDGTGGSSTGALYNVSGNNTWGGAITLAGNTRVNSLAGALTISNTVNLQGNALLIQGASTGTNIISGVISSSPTATGSIQKVGAGAWTLSGTNTFTGGVSLYNGTLIINNAQALGTVAGTFTIGGVGNAVTIDNTSGGDITTLNYPLALNDHFTYTGSVPRNLNLGTGTITLNANRQITVSAGTLTIGGTLNDNTKNITKTGAGTLSFGGNSVTLKDLSITAGTLVTTSGTLNLAGNFSNSGTFTHNSGTVVFNGSSAQTLGGSSVSTFNNISINNNTGVTLNSAENMDGVLTLTSGLLQTSASNLLTLNAGASASYTDGSTSAFVNGPLAKTGTTLFTFPVGVSGAGMRTIGISAPGASTTFQARLYRAPSPNKSSLGSGITQVSNCEYWTLDRTAGSSNVGVTLSWNTGSPCNAGLYVTNISDLRVSRYDGSAWVNEGNSSSTGSNSAGTITSNTVTSFSPFSLAGSTAGTNPLPVKFTRLKVWAVTGANKVEWTNATESDVLRYEVERSVDGNNFNTAISVLPVRNDGQQADYSVLDAFTNVRIVFYRVKAVEFSGRQYMTAIVRLQTDGKDEKLLIYPNPSKDDMIFLQSPDLGRGMFQVRIFNASGKEVYSQKQICPGGRFTQSIALPEGTPAGIYSLRLYKETMPMGSANLILR